MRQRRCADAMSAERWERAKNGVKKQHAGSPERGIVTFPTSIRVPLSVTCSSHPPHRNMPTARAPRPFEAVGAAILSQWAKRGQENKTWSRIEGARGGGDGRSGAAQIHGAPRWMRDGVMRAAIVDDHKKNSMPQKSKSF